MSTVGHARLIKGDDCSGEPTVSVSFGGSMISLVYKVVEAACGAATGPVGVR